MEGGEVLANKEEFSEAQRLIEIWKETFHFRLGPRFLLAPGYKVHTLERLLASEY